MFRSALRNLRMTVKFHAHQDSHRKQVIFPKFMCHRTLTTQNAEAPEDTALTNKNRMQNFMSVWPDIVRDLRSHAEEFDKKFAPQWLTKALEYNVPHGKKNRGLIVVESVEILTKNSQKLEQNLRLARILGWCVEMHQAWLLIDDDIIDGSITRRGRPCWYQLEDVGVAALNDAMLIENAIYVVIGKYFRQTDCYREIVDLFREITLITIIGELQDIKACGSLEIDHFTAGLHTSIVTNKTAFYSFYFPVALAMHMAGYKDPKLFEQAKAILLEIGVFFQSQDDFIDCFGDPAVTGKIGTDIEDGKCTWLAVRALERANEQQRSILRECYGRKEPEKVKRVKELYEDLGLRRAYEDYQEVSRRAIESKIQQVSRELPQKLFVNVFEKIYKRES